MKNPIYRTGFPTAETKNRLRPSLNLAYAFVIALCVLLLIKMFARSGVLLVIMYMGILHCRVQASNDAPYCRYTATRFDQT